MNLKQDPVVEEFMFAVNSQKDSRIISKESEIFFENWKVTD